MNQTERRIYLINKLFAEQPRRKRRVIPEDAAAQKDLLRALMNTREPGEIGNEFLPVQNAYLQEEIASKGITDLDDLSPVSDGICLWQGDITTLRCDAIVNAANSGMTGCYIPGHGCVDNCIHSFAGVQLRMECAELMREQGHKEKPGKAKITYAYNLPCRFILHTVSPIIFRKVTKEKREQLASCYRSCLELAERYGIKSIAFCCIGTGRHGFPQEQAAEIAVQTVKAFQAQPSSTMQVIFVVFNDRDHEIYRNILETK